VLSFAVACSNFAVVSESVAFPCENGKVLCTDLPHANSQKKLASFDAIDNRLFLFILLKCN